MINVTLHRVQGEISGFEISGHAESGPYGHDLVCAAVSAVSFGAVNSLVTLCDFEPHVEQGGEGGFLSLFLPEGLSEETRNKAQLLLEGMVVSLQTIELDYNQYIKISNQ